MNQQNIMKRGLLQEIDDGCRVLILGSFPSELSLRESEYYGNPRNGFWKIIESLFNIPADAPYHDRVQSLKSCRIGLSDVYQSCYRKGSLDNAIQSPEFTDLASVLKTYPSIQVIILNGKEAEKGLKRYLTSTKPEMILKAEIITLPSTSPANTRSIEMKLAEWSILKKKISEQNEDFPNTP